MQSFLNSIFPFEYPQPSDTPLPRPKRFHLFFRNQRMHIVQVRIHRGSNQIGGSCIEVRSGNQSILIDAGQALAPETSAPIPPTLSDLDFPSLLCVIISHPHLDHYGLLPWLPEIPVAMGKAARSILNAAASFLKQPLSAPSGPSLIDREPLTLGRFTITPYLVDHSAYDAYALLIEADGKHLLYSGDFRMHGRKQGAMERLLADPPAHIDVLLMEGTTLGRSGNSKEITSETKLEELFVSAFRETSGLALVQTATQNIDRLVTLYRACLKARRTLVIDLYTAIILAATGNSRIPQSHWPNIATCVPFNQRLIVFRNKWFQQLEAHSRHRLFLKRDIAANPKQYVMLFRNQWRRELEIAQCLSGASFIYSMWPGYQAQDTYRQIAVWLEQNQIHSTLIHTSGHASQNDLRRFAQAMAPKQLVPIHTERPEAYNDFGIAVKRHSDGEWWTV